MADNNPSQNKKLWKWKRKWKRKRRPENDTQQQNDCQREAVFREQKTTTLTVTFSSRPGPDQSSGRPGPDQSSGRPGSDQSSGRPGSDQSSSRPGPHQSSGRPGQDQYSSRPGSDQSSGRPGPDRSSGRPGPHQSCSRPGPDQSSGRPGPDQSSGRPGPDRSSSRPGPEHSQVYNDTIPQPQSQLAAVSDSSESESEESHTDSSRAPAAPPPPPPPPAAPAGPSSAQGRGQRPCSPSPAVVPSRCLAIDCEMVGAGPKGHISQLARCSIVSYDGDVIYDRFVLPPLPVTDYRTRWSGIRRSDLARATPYEVARKEILKLLWGKVLVGHAIHNDLKALNHSHPRALIRDTSRIPLLNTRAGFSEREMVSLKRLTKAIFNRDIQTGRKGHSSVEDAKATMELYRVVASEWEQKMAAERK